MKITPIEIRQHTFEKAMRGYRPDEVDAFLSSLSQEWERVVGDQKMLRMQLELAEKELNKLREVEMTLFRTLKTAEDTSSQIAEQARVAGEQHVGDARQKADDMLADARKRSAVMVQDAENQARFIKDNIINDLKSTEHDLKALERYKDNLVNQIRTLATNANESVDRFEQKFARQSIQGKINEVTAEVDALQTPPAGEVPAPQPDTETANVVALPADAEVPAETPTILDTVSESQAPEPADEHPTEPVARLVETDPTVPAAPVTDSSEDMPPLSDEDDELPTVANVSESIMAGVRHAVEHQTDGHSPEPNGQAATPATVSETDEKKEGGSFFDQI